MNTVLQLIKWFFGLLLGIAILGLGFVFLAPFLFGVQYIIVLSGSMTPVMPVGSVIVVKQIDTADVLPGDIITYYHPNNRDGLDVLVTHRVIELAALEDGTPAFQTKGDANEEPDDYLVTAANVQGKGLVVVPGVGLTRDFIRSLAGYLMLILVPGVVILVSEVMSYRNEHDRRRMALKRRRRRHGLMGVRS